MKCQSNSWPCLCWGSTCVTLKCKKKDVRQGVTTINDLNFLPNLLRLSSGWTLMTFEDPKDRTRWMDALRRRLREYGIFSPCFSGHPLQKSSEETLSGILVLYDYHPNCSTEFTEHPTAHGWQLSKEALFFLGRCSFRFGSSILRSFSVQDQPATPESAAQMACRKRSSEKSGAKWIFPQRVAMAAVVLKNPSRWISLVDRWLRLRHNTEIMTFFSILLALWAALSGASANDGVNRSHFLGRSAVEVTAMGAKCGPIDSPENAGCKEVVEWAAGGGKNDPSASGWFRNMPTIAGVTYGQGTVADFQRLYYCAPPGKDKFCGLPPCTGCSNPPCNDCFAGHPMYASRRPGCDGNDKGVGCVPPKTAMGYKGQHWPTSVIYGVQEIHKI